MDDLEELLTTRLHGPDPAIPPAVDAAVLGAGAAAARAFARRRRLRLAQIAAAAAVVLVAAWLGVHASGTPPRPFDVADAWRVAAGFEHDTARFDVDGDGRVDRGDAELMLTRIVALGAQGGG
ncbi:MAG: hypothetical protein IPM29_26645 [Planctomycetes bacterium]|nr:hypothetical protein [Planctomycetota bacterium]